MFDKRLKEFKDIHLGNHCIITACGPSLNDVPVEKLRNELVFGVSLAYKKEGLNIDYHFMGDMKVAEQVHDEITHQDNVWFVSDSIYKRFFRDRSDTYYFTGHGRKAFHADVSKRIYGGGTSTFLAMQFAYYMGCHEVFVVGLDHYKSYHEKDFNVYKTEQKNPSGEHLVISAGKDEHHFDENYYGKGFKFYAPTRWKMEQSYKMARETFEKSGRKIWNASTTTALPEEILPRIDLEVLWC